MLPDTMAMPSEAGGRGPLRGRLVGRRILVVGGGQTDIGEPDTPIGNGRAISVLCAREGALGVAVADRDEAAAKATVALCHNRAFAIVADVTKESDIARMVDEAVGKLGGL